MTKSSSAAAATSPSSILFSIVMISAILIGMVGIGVVISMVAGNKTPSCPGNRFSTSPGGYVY